jgi:hypothetical protein
MVPVFSAMPVRAVVVADNPQNPPHQHHQVKSSSQNSVTPRADDGRDVS